MSRFDEWNWLQVIMAGCFVGPVLLLVPVCVIALAVRVWQWITN